MAATIVVPLDGSPLAEKALPLAVTMAKRIEGRILLAQVVPPPHELFWGYSEPLTPAEQSDLLRESAANYLRRLEGEVRRKGVTVSYVTPVGPVGETIVNVAEEHDAAYIIMSTHGRGGLSRWMLGSVAGRVLHLTDRPLLVLPPQSDNSYGEWKAPSLDRVVVPLDGSPEAEQILPHARAVATLCGARLFLIRAASTVPPLNNGMSVPVVDASWYEASRAQAREYLQGIQQQLEREGYSAAFCVASEPAAEAILEYAEEVGAGLITMTSHAREGLSRLVLGSVTDRVVRSGQRPVLVTRMQGNP